jgi:hypothetical protein
MVNRRFYSQQLEAGLSTALAEEWRWALADWLLGAEQTGLSSDRAALMWEASEHGLESGLAVWELAERGIGPGPGVVDWLWMEQQLSRMLAAAGLTLRAPATRYVSAPGASPATGPDGRSGFLPPAEVPSPAEQEYSPP